VFDQTSRSLFAWRLSALQAHCRTSKAQPAYAR